MVISRIYLAFVKAAASVQPLSETQQHVANAAYQKRSEHFP